MDQEKQIVLTGKNLTVAEIGRIVRKQEVMVTVAERAFDNVERARRFVDEQKDKEIIYGVNTGFGPMASHIIGADDILSLQENLIRSHAAGAGEPIDDRFVLAAMVIRLNMFLLGHSGVSRALVERLTDFINKRIIPIVPEHGAVGTSGDLVQLAHIALALIGEGEVRYKGVRQSSASALKKAGLSKKYILQAKEGLALINGTSLMTGIGSVFADEAIVALDTAIENGAWALELVHGFSDSIEKTLHDLRPHEGQGVVAARMRALLKDSHALQRRSDLNGKEKPNHVTHEILTDVQNVYSFRCIPQILGPVHDALVSLRETLEVEMNSVTDNPIIDVARKRFLHGGNFHGDYIAAAIDQFKMTLVKLTMLSERRINYLLNANANRRFTPFLNLNTPGLTLALQGVQFVATSTTARSQTLAFPQYVHSIPTNGDNQDVVSMGSDAALIAYEVLENAFVVLAIESVTLAQLVDVTECGETLSSSAQTRFRTIRADIPAIKHDRSISEELNILIRKMRT